MKGMSLKSGKEKLLAKFRRKRRTLTAEQAALPPVVLIHGLGVPRQMMSVLAWRLRRAYGRRTINLGFNTFTHDLPDCAELISRTLAERQIRQFDCVTHSTGGVLLRWAMNHRPMPKLRRAVLVSAPNSGAASADIMHRRVGGLYPLVFGSAGLQLRHDHRGLAGMAGYLPGVEFGVIAGGSGTPRGLRNILGIPGDNDGIVAVEETILPGMKDFVLLNLDHTRVLFSRQTAHMVNLFLTHGVFRPNLPPASH